MDLIRTSIERPIAVVAAVLMVLMFGYVSFTTIPIQLAPDVSKPVISVRTNWFGAAPAEVEREIINEQEEKLKGIEGLVEMTSRSLDGRGTIELEFAVGTNMDKALLLVANSLDRVESYPDEADEPILRTSGTEDNAIAWFILKALPGTDRPVNTFGDFAEDVIQDRLERVSGVGKVNVYGGSEREMEVLVDPQRMARFRLTVPDVVAALRAADASATAGDVEEGKRRYVVRTEGDLDSLDAVRQVVVRTEMSDETGRIGRVTIADLGEVRFSHKDPTARIRHLGGPSMAINATRERGANVIETMEGLREAIAELQAGPVKDAGLMIRQVYDETVYINSAIDLVVQNIYIGGALAAVILLLFLRSWRATAVVSFAIPISVIGSFVAMAMLGRSLNVISLAGLAFAVGMVVDAAIVVLENIFRLRQQGLSARAAAYEGARQVWGAVLVSALTTVMVFIPILVMELEVGQLFRDIAVAISVSVLLSLLVAVTLIPALSSRLLVGNVGDPARSLKLPGIDHFGRGFSALCVGFARLVCRSKVFALLVVLLVSGSSIAVTWALLPKLEYLPEGNRNLVFGVILPPPGYNLGTTTEIAYGVEAAVKPLFVEPGQRTDEASDEGPSLLSVLQYNVRKILAPLTGMDPNEGVDRPPPGIVNFFFVATTSRTFLGAVADQPERVSELIPVLSDPVFTEPGTFGFINQPSIFGRSIGGGRRIDIDISGADLEVILGVARQATGRIFQAMPTEEGNQFRPRPGLELGAPEVRVYPDRTRLADAGVTALELAQTLDAFNDGLRVREITVGGERIDLMVSGDDRNVDQTQGIEALPVVTREGLIVPASSLAQIEVTAGPTEIRHRERIRTVTLEVRPAPGIATEEAMEILQSQVITPLQEAGLPTGVRMRLSGTADQLTATWNEMVVDLLMALIIVYLVMAVLFESFIYPLIIVLSVPLATAGAVLGLAVMNLYTFQPLDMLTLLGFVILIGIVVNNAILLVHQTLHHIREDGLTYDAAIVEATRNRIRPIFMSTLTSVFGMMPLVVFPGAGSELYRGLGSVVVGGLSMSAVLTLAIIPPLLSMVLAVAERRRTAPAAAGGRSEPRAHPAPGDDD